MKLKNIKKIIAGNFSIVLFSLVLMQSMPVITKADTTNEDDDSAFQKIELEYNDYFEFEGSFVSFSDENVTSYKVVSGACTNEKDTAVATIVSDNKIFASGTGTVTLKTTTNTYEITVKAAPLTVMYLLGQSNMEGFNCGNSNASPSYSASSPDGEVYSTYMSADIESEAVSNITNGELTTTYTSARDCFPAFPASLSVAETTSLAGTELEYKLNALTESGTGKTGIDGALAHEWNSLTGDKVWVINLAWSSSYIEMWTPGNIAYKRAFVAMKTSEWIIDAEVSAGHFIKKHSLAFWDQGEYDSMMSASEYTDYFLTMYNSLKQAVGIEKIGIISSRVDSTMTDYQGISGIYESGPRWAQYSLAESEDYPDIIMASNVNEYWVTDGGVNAYFSCNPVQSYPGRETCETPTSKSQIYADLVHFSQAAQNENGRTAALNMYVSVTENSTGVYFDGKKVTYLEIRGGLLYRNGIPDYAYTGFATTSDQNQTYYVTNGFVDISMNGISDAMVAGCYSSYKVKNGEVIKNLM